MTKLVKRNPVVATKEIFVFGSNLAGHHGGGAAAYAREHYGAIMGVGVGRQGRSYAIPTKDEHINTLSLDRIYPYVEQFLEYASKKAVSRPNLRFRLTRIGCGLAGLNDRQIAPMFKGAPMNVTMPDGWFELSEGLDLPGRMYFLQLGNKDKHEVWGVSEGHAVTRWADMMSKEGKPVVIACIRHNWWLLDPAEEGRGVWNQRLHLNIRPA